MTATLGGDQAAFGELVARYKDAVFGVAFHRLGDFEDARDAAQDAFVKAYVNLPKLRDGAAFSHWLYRIAEGTAVDVLRRRRSDVSLESPDALSADLGTAGFSLPPHSPHMPHSPVGDDALVARQVREALAQLAEPDRLAVVLHYVNGYSHAEVAQFLGTTAGAVKTRVSRAKAKLRKEMAEMVETRLKCEATRFSYEASDGDGRTITGTSEAGSAAAVRKRLRDKGFNVLRVWRETRTPYEQKDDAVKQFSQMIIEQAVRDSAAAVRITVGRGGVRGPLKGFWLVGDTWHHCLEVSTAWLWPDLRERFAHMAGIRLSDSAARQSGVIAFEFGGRQRHLKATFYRKSIRLDLE